MGFGLKKKNKSKKNEIDFSQVMKGKKFPLLILDEHWIKLFPEEKMPQQLRELRNQLNDLLKKQSRVMEELKGIKRYKSQLMQEIVDNMEVDETPTGQIKGKKLQKNQKMILDMNEKLKATEESLEQIPIEIEELNEVLVAESSRICYEKMRQNQENVQQLEQEINNLRVLLKQKIIQKQDEQAESIEIYSYMHNMFGAGIMEFMDESYRRSLEEEMKRKEEQEENE